MQEQSKAEATLGRICKINSRSNIMENSRIMLSFNSVIMAFNANYNYSNFSFPFILVFLFEDTPNHTKHYTNDKTFDSSFQSSVVYIFFITA